MNDPRWDRLRLRFEDADSWKIVEIAEFFLTRFFSHPPAEARELVLAFFAGASVPPDEDAIHHESSYRLAARIHYVAHLKGKPRVAGDWLVTSGHINPPPEAIELFRERYFTQTSR